MTVILMIRNFAGIFVLILAIVALGLSANMEHVAREVGYSTPAAFICTIVASIWALFFEIFMLVFRNIYAHTILGTWMVEMLGLLISAIIWLIAGDLTSQANSSCTNNPYPTEIIGTSSDHSIEQNTNICSQIKGQIAMIWLSFSVNVILMIYLSVGLWKVRARGMTKVWIEPLKNMEFESRSKGEQLPVNRV